MERFGSILAVLRDGDMPGHVHALASLLARANRAALHFVDVIDAATATEDEVAARRARLAEAVATAELAGVPASEAVVRGDPAVEVIRMVLREGHDLLLIPAEGSDGTAARLLAECPCPVWLVADARPGTVIALLPPGGGEDGRRVAAMARNLASHLGAEVIEATEGAMPVVAASDLIVGIMPVRQGRPGRCVLALKPEGFVSPVTLEAAPMDSKARGETPHAGKG